MIIILKNDSQKEDVDRLVRFIEAQELKINEVDGTDRRLLCIIGHTYNLDIDILKSFKCVADVKRIDEPYNLVSRENHRDDTVITLTEAAVKTQIGTGLTFIAGPCSIESEEQINSIARKVAEYGAGILRGGAYKPRSSPYSFQGLKNEGLRMLADAGKSVGLPTISELTEISQLEYFDDIDIIQIGARNMQNYELLKEIGAVKKPVLLKRGLSATISELLMSAEYIISSGNPNVILCERGIRTFETATRNTLDLSAIPLLKLKTHLPVVVDPSHATGIEELVSPMALAAAAAGAHGIMLEVNDNPEQALCDGQQCISTEAFKTIVEKSKAIVELIGGSKH